MIHTTLIALLLLGAPTDASDRALRKATEAFIRAQLSLPSEDVSVEFRSIPVVPGVDGITFRIAPEGVHRLIGNVSLPVEAEAEGKTIWRSFISVRIRVYRTALVAVRTIDRHEPVSMVDLVAQRTEIRDLSERFVMRDAELRGKRAARRIRGGSIIMESVLETAPVVRANDPVTIIATVGNVIVRTQGVAREDGRMGDRIVVQRSDSPERITGKVTGPSTVTYAVETSR